MLGHFFPWCAGWAAELKQLFAAYVEAKQEQNVLDYDDLLLYWAQMVSDPALADEIGGRFDHVLVDEYQDTNRLQSSILLALKPGGRGLTVVGDDAQSIYSFRAATVRNILDFPEPVQSDRGDHHARPQLPLDAADPCGRQRRDRSCHRTIHQEPLDRAQSSTRKPQTRQPFATRPIRRVISSSGCWKTARTARALKAAGGACFARRITAGRWKSN